MIRNMIQEQNEYICVRASNGNWFTGILPAECDAGDKSVSTIQTTIRPFALENITKMFSELCDFMD